MDSSRLNSDNGKPICRYWAIHIGAVIHNHTQRIRITIGHQVYRVCCSRSDKGMDTRAAEFRVLQREPYGNKPSRGGGAVHEKRAVTKCQ